mmetsp:Transcript_21587/g.49414  ORF Transcript_21587/g.49414 Transcript_21587/m.49414 type:complete len:203 (-) Transcript_21587:159-767(-)
MTEAGPQCTPKDPRTNSNTSIAILFEHQSPHFFPSHLASIKLAVSSLAFAFSSSALLLTFSTVSSKCLPISNNIAVWAIDICGREDVFIPLKGVQVICLWIILWIWPDRICVLCFMYIPVSRRIESSSTSNPFSCFREACRWTREPSSCNTIPSVNATIKKTPPGRIIPMCHLLMKLKSRTRTTSRGWTLHCTPKNHPQSMF